MGMGYTLSEHLVVERGVVRNPSFRDYKEKVQLPITP